MEDQQIIELFWQRSETALDAVKQKYGARALRFANNLLNNRQDAEECVSDALMALWQQIPPERPRHLWAYFSRLVRNIGCSRLDYLCAARRDRGSEVCLSELEDCFISLQTPETALESGRITLVINQFLDGLDDTGRRIFVRRYYYFDSCADIGKMVGLSRGAVNTRLSRLRQKLKNMLEKEEIFV